MSPVDDAGLLALLACPRCRAALVATEGGATCAGCGCAFRTLEAGTLDLRIGRRGDVVFDPAYYDTLSRVEARHFWFVSRREHILRRLRHAIPDLATRPVFDIGSGSGGLLDFLARSGQPIAAACDAYPEGLRLIAAKTGVPTVVVDEGRLPPLGRGQRLITLFDVLEHVDDDVDLLTALHDVLEPGGYVALTVPAHPFLFDEMDRMAHHRRRYTRATLRAALTSAGFEVADLGHFMALLVPLLLASRLLGRLVLGRRHEQLRRSHVDFSLTPVVNPTLKTLLRCEHRLLAGRLPWGTSLLAIGRRPGPVAPQTTSPRCASDGPSLG